MDEECKPVEINAENPQPGGRRTEDFLRVSLDGREWHSFAVSTCGREAPDRYCLVIRRAGDWTEHLGLLCETDRPPTSLLVRQLRGFGFMGHAPAYRRVLVVATGAGIGPVLLYLLDRRQPGLRCLWIGCTHEVAIGADLVARVVNGGQTTLIDTTPDDPMWRVWSPSMPQRTQSSWSATEPFETKWPLRARGWGCAGTVPPSTRERGWPG